MLGDARHAGVPGIGGGFPGVDAWLAGMLAVALVSYHLIDQITVLDLNRIVCPDGKVTWRVDGLRIRGGGLHYTPSGVQKIIAPWLLPKLAAVAEGTFRPSQD